jgi:anti-anti-sigma factor
MTRAERKEPLCVDGEMTIYTATEIKLRLMEALARAERLDVDLSAVTEVDTAGVQLLILAKQEAVRLGKSLRYLKHSGSVVEILEFCNLTGQFDDPVVSVGNR